MSKIVESSLELVGKTPLLKLKRYTAKNGITDATILAKLEYLNPAGSVKDRIALAMIEDAKKKPAEGIWCRACTDRRLQGYERCHCQG